MSKETLIINRRHEMPKRKRVIWDVLTIGLWLGFIYLWKPVLIVFYGIMTLEETPDQISDWIYENISSVTFEHAVTMLVATPIILFVLSRLNRHRAPSEHLIYEPSDYADYFNIEISELQQCSDSQYVSVYHDANGHIIHLNGEIEVKNKEK